MYVTNHSTRVDKTYKMCLHVNLLKYHQKYESCEKPLKGGILTLLTSLVVPLID
jgi:hypothetical protein